MDERQTPVPEQPRVAPPSGLGTPSSGLGTTASGRTNISEQAVAKVAAIAARDVPGVFVLGTGSNRALGALRDAVGGADITQGVHVEVGQTQAAVDISLIAVYGEPLHQVANNVRAAVYEAVETLVGLQVIEVNVEIHDVHVPEAAEARTVARAEITGGLS